MMGEEKSDQSREKAGVGRREGRRKGMREEIMRKGTPEGRGRIR